MANTESSRNGTESPASRARVNGGRAVAPARAAASRATVPSAAAEADSRGNAFAP